MADTLSVKANNLIEHMTKDGYYEYVSATETYVPEENMWYLTLKLRVVRHGHVVTNSYFRESGDYELEDTGVLPCGCIDVCRCRSYDW